MKDEYDLIVLGAGSGGLAAAKRAASYGARVAVVEGDKVGGTCVIRGCVPKKLLVYGSQFYDNLDEAESFGVNLSNTQINVQKLLENVRKEVSRLNELHVNFLSKSGVELFYGWGRFCDSNTISILDEHKKVIKNIRAKRILIAVGGKPVRLNIPGSEKAWISDDVFIQKSFPEKIVIVGGGFIACEFACILNSLGVKIVQIVRRNYLLRGFDKEVSSVLQKEMQNKNISIIFEGNPVRIDGKYGELSVKIDSGEDFSCNAILLATGRRPFIDGLNLKDAGVLTLNGKISVDSNNMTNSQGIFAIGDVTDRINLTPVAIEEGRVFSDRFYGNKPRNVNYDFVPKAVFSQPEIAMVGLSEEEAIQAYGKENLDIHRTKFRPMSHALSKQGPSCFLKLLVDKDSERIIGCHMLGEHSAEIIQMAAIALQMGATKKDFDSTMALHPTISEEFVTMN